MGPSIAGLIFTLFPAVLSAARPFCADEDATRAYFRHLCDYIVQEKSQVPVIFTGSYYMRDLVAGYKIFGDRRYLDTALATRKFEAFLARRPPTPSLPGTGTRAPILRNRACSYPRLDPADQLCYDLGSEPEGIQGWELPRTCSRTRPRSCWAGRETRCAARSYR